MKCPVCGKLYKPNGLSNHLFKQKDEKHLSFIRKIDNEIVNAFYKDISCIDLSTELSKKYNISICVSRICSIWKTINGYKERKQVVKSKSLTKHYQNIGVRILEKHPYLEKEWDYSRNKEPEKYSFKSNKKVWWCCEKGHKWKASPNTRSKGHGCPYCSGRKVVLEESLPFKFSDLCKEWDYSKNKISPYKCRSKSNIKVWWRCKNGHSWKAWISTRTSGHNCPFCDGQRATKENNITITDPYSCKYFDYDKNTKLPENYLRGSKQKVWWRCKNGHSIRISVRNFTKRENKCLICSKKVASDEYNLLLLYPEICKEWDYDKNSISPKDVSPYSKKQVWWKCSKGHVWKSCIDSRTSAGTNCKKCNDKSVSILCSQWLDSLGILSKNREIRIGRYIVDGFQDNIVYEYLGDFWHGNPSLFHPNKINRVTKNKYGNLLYNTIFRLNSISNNYKVIYRWESENVDKLYKPIRLVKNEILKVASEFFGTDNDILEL